MVETASGSVVCRLGWLVLRFVPIAAPRGGRPAPSMTSPIGVATPLPLTAACAFLFGTTGKTDDYRIEEGRLPPIPPARNTRWSLGAAGVRSGNAVLSPTRRMAIGFFVPLRPEFQLDHERPLGVDEGLMVEPNVEVNGCSG